MSETHETMLLEQILAEVRKTNGRVTRHDDRIEDIDDRVLDLHRAVFGSEEHRVVGLITRQEASDKLVREWQALRKILTVVGGLLTALGVPLFTSYFGG